MELAIIILAIGIAVYMNSDSSGAKKEILRKLVVQVDKDIKKEFNKRDEKIRSLEKRVKELESKRDIIKNKKGDQKE